MIHISKLHDLWLRGNVDTCNDCHDPAGGGAVYKKRLVLISPLSGSAGQETGSLSRTMASLQREAIDFIPSMATGTAKR